MQAEGRRSREADWMDNVRGRSLEVPLQDAVLDLAVPDQCRLANAVGDAEEDAVRRAGRALDLRQHLQLR